MDRISTFKLLIVFAVALSLTSLAGPMSSLQLPGVQLAHANSQPCQTMNSYPACTEYWYPAGPAMNTLQTNLISNGCAGEYSTLTSISPTIDLTDCSLQSIGGTTTICNPPTIYITAADPNNFCYLSNWSRASNDAAATSSPYNGLPNYFTWLNIYNSLPTTPGTIRQGFSSSTSSVNPYVASNAQDQYIDRNIFDTLYQVNPANPGQVLEWMTISTQVVTPLYTPPPGTALTFRFTLNPGLFFQDGRPVTAYDVAFSYLSMIGSGAFLGSTAAPFFTGITILSPRQFDINGNSGMSFPTITTVPIVSGHYWTNAGPVAWDTQVNMCTGSTPCSLAEYALAGSTVICPGPGCTSFPANLMTVNPTEVSASFDPILNHVLVGSGPWECGPVTIAGSGMCTPTGMENPPPGIGYTLTRFGNGLPPASSISNIYFRSSGDLALYLWSEENNITPIIPYSEVAACYNVPVSPGPCSHWQQGIGASPSGVVGVNQVSEVATRYNIDWISPFNWATMPLNLPMGMVPTNPATIPATDPTLYEGSATLNPAIVVGCASPYPIGGYDC